jgi:hypothetical protein
MAQTRFTSALTDTEDPACQSYARVTVVDTEWANALACPRHAVAALTGIIGTYIDWSDSNSLNGWERKALGLAGERSPLGYRWPGTMLA